MKHIGMLTVRNEVDIINEFLDDVEKYFDDIVVMDDSTDGTYEAIAARPIVDYLVKFDSVYAANSRRTDGQKEHLFRHIMQKHGGNTWITNLNADALFGDDPNEAVELAERAGEHLIRWRTYDFRPHATDKPAYNADKQAWLATQAKKRLTWCKDFTWTEWLQFRAFDWHVFDVNKHHHVIPANFEHMGRHFKGIEPVLLHYPLRSPEQIIARRADRLATGFRTADYFEEVINGGFFTWEESGYRHVKFEKAGVSLGTLGRGNERFRQGNGGLAHYDKVGGDI